jgi:hypothetical protein
MTPVPRCINRLSSTTVIKDTTEQGINWQVKDSCREYYGMPPDLVFRGVDILLNNPMLVGFTLKRKKILLPFVKPCFGPMLIELDAEDGDFEFLRTTLGNGTSGGWRSSWLDCRDSHGMPVFSGVQVRHPRRYIQN